MPGQRRAFRVLFLSLTLLLAIGVLWPERAPFVTLASQDPLFDEAPTPRPEPPARGPMLGPAQHSMDVVLDKLPGPLAQRGFTGLLP